MPLLHPLTLCLVALRLVASHMEPPPNLLPRAAPPPPSTLTIPVTLSPSSPGAPTSTQALTITLNPPPDPGPAFTPFPGPAVPDMEPACKTLDELVSSCTTLGPAFYTLPRSAQAQCLCNVGPWDSVATECFDHLTSLGQWYASSMTSHGLLGLCESFGAGPTMSETTSTSVSDTIQTTAATGSSTRVETTGSGTGSGMGGSTTSATQNGTRSSTQGTTRSSTQGTTHATTQTTATAATGSGSVSLAGTSLLVWLLPWLLVL